MRRVLPVLLLMGCQWIDEDDGRLDDDEDGVPVREDCNDRNGEYAYLQPFHGDLTCGQSLEADNHAGFDAMQIANCLHPFQEEDLTRMMYKEQVYRFLSATATDVQLTLHATDMLVGTEPNDTGGIGLLAIQGPRCLLDSCRVGLPPMPGEWRIGEKGKPIPVEERDTTWEPTVLFHAEPGEAWFAIVTGGDVDAADESSPYTLDVDCPTVQ